MPTLKEIKTTEWYKTRPTAIKKLICKFPPFSTVIIKSTRQKAYMYSYFNNGTLKLAIDPQENKDVGNALNEPYMVFGYKPEDIKFICENPELYFECEE